MSVTPNSSKEDFIGALDPPATKELHGLKGKMEVVGTGAVSRKMFDEEGVTRTIKTKSHYIPGCSIRLFSPQVYFLEQGGKEELFSDKILLT